MAITQMITDSGKPTFSVYVNLRSKTMPHIRLQKRITKIGTNAEAKRVERNLLLSLSREIAYKEGHGFSWRMVVNHWAGTVLSEDYFDRKYNPATVRDYVSMLNRWTKDWLEHPASEITRGDGREVLDAVLLEGRSKAFQKRLKNTINMIYNWGIENRIIRGVQHSPVYGCKIKLQADKRPEILKVNEIRKLLYVAKTENHSWYYVWAMALMTGMRNGELFALKCSDVNFENRIINVERSFNFKCNQFKDTKAGYWRTVPISDELRNLLLEMMNSSKDEFVLPRIVDWRGGKQAKILKAFCRKIEIPEVKFHTLRACFATQLIGSGVEPVKVMKICGWKDLKTLAVYLRLSGVDERGATDGLELLPKILLKKYYSNCVQ